MFKQYCVYNAKEDIVQDAIQIWTYEFLEEGYECEQKKISKTQQSVTETEAELLVCELLLLFSAIYLSTINLYRMGFNGVQAVVKNTDERESLQNHT